MRLTMIGGAVGALVVWGVAFAGDLNPPPGPVAGTMKTLDEIEARVPIGPETTPGNAFAVYRITEPGSYYLTGDVLGESGKGGIEILTSRVTIDLNGYRLLGVAETGDAIRCGVPARQIRIENGVIANWEGDGIDLGIGTRSHSIARVSVEQCGGLGISVLGGGVIESCDVHECEIGIRCFDGEAVIRSCVVSSCVTDGLLLSGASVTEGCVSSGNGQRGFFIGRGGRASGCVSTGNRFGFSLLGGAVLESCVATDNTLEGIVSNEGVTVRGCESNGNLRGISVRSGSEVVGNRCSGNGETGIEVGRQATPSVGSRVVGNAVVDNGVIGLIVRGEGNFVFGNSSSGSQIEISIDPGNVAGPILDETSILDSKHPQANFAY